VERGNEQQVLTPNDFLQRSDKRTSTRSHDDQDSLANNSITNKSTGKTRCKYNVILTHIHLEGTNGSAPLYHHTETLLKVTAARKYLNAERRSRKWPEAQR
jgi:hypothetical protein